jgi:hypothetical protein
MQPSVHVSIHLCIHIPIYLSIHTCIHLGHGAVWPSDLCIHVLRVCMCVFPARAAVSAAPAYPACADPFPMPVDYWADGGFSMYACMYACMCMYVCMHVCMHMCMHARMYILRI